MRTLTFAFLDKGSKSGERCFAAKNALSYFDHSIIRDCFPSACVCVRCCGGSEDLGIPVGLEVLSHVQGMGRRDRMLHRVRQASPQKIRGAGQLAPRAYRSGKPPTNCQKRRTDRESAIPPEMARATRGPATRIHGCKSQKSPIAVAWAFQVRPAS